MSFRTAESEHRNFSRFSRPFCRWLSKRLPSGNSFNFQRFLFRATFFFVVSDRLIKRFAIHCYVCWRSGRIGTFIKAIFWKRFASSRIRFWRRKWKHRRSVAKFDLKYAFSCRYWWVQIAANDSTNDSVAISHRDPRIRSNKNKIIATKVEEKSKTTSEKVATMREELEIQLQKDRSSPVKV